MNTSLSDADPTDYAVLIAASHAGTCIAVVGAVLNGALLASAVRHRATIIIGRSAVSLLIAIILALSLLLAVLSAVLNELWVYSVTAPGVDNLFDSLLYTEGVDTTLSSLVYLVLHALFSANLLLALERHWLVRFGKSVSKITMWLVFAVGTIFACFTSASLFLSVSSTSNTPHHMCVLIFGLFVQTGVDWGWLPLGKPYQNVTNSYEIAPMQSTLFLMGLSYFPLAAVAICFVYENTYFQIATIFENCVELEESVPDNNLDLDKRSCPSSQHNVAIQRAALVRCVLMSVGLVVWYCPSIIALIASVVDENIEMWVNEYIWTIVLFGVMPSFDAMWTFLVIMLFQPDFRNALGQDVGLLLAKISNSVSRRNKSERTAD
ncbi:hypothetical protein HDU84_006292 [Entophlyctis sp. JEL0112]|nr:hypothetical protein HDU84_006292 [Entophlyctis sp. JEL0112]